MDEGHVSAADVDFADLGRCETLLDQDRPECIERGVNAGDVGIHLEADVAGFPIMAQSLDQSRGAWPTPQKQNLKQRTERRGSQVAAASLSAAACIIVAIAPGSLWTLPPVQACSLLRHPYLLTRT